jgi:hypothetical protein
MFVICLSGAKFANETFIFTQRLEMGSNVTNAISLSLANFVGSVVGCLDVCINTPAEPPPCRRVIL